MPTRDAEAEVWITAGDAACELAARQLLRVTTHNADKIIHVS